MSSEYAGGASAGVLRFYDRTKSFGFVALDCGEDAYLAGSVVHAASVDPGELVPGTRLCGTVDWAGTPSLTSLSPPDGSLAPVPPRRDTESGTGEGTMHRWVAERGFGFVRVVGAPADVFVHVTVAERSGTVPREGATFRVTWERQRDKVVALAIGEVAAPAPEPAEPRQPEAAFPEPTRQPPDDDHLAGAVSPLDPPARLRADGWLGPRRGLGPVGSRTMAR